MTIPIVITFCTLLLIAYVFDLTSAKTRIPSVILLLLLGWSVRRLTILIDLPLPDFFPFLPVLGTIGLILIVLEGSLELEMNKSKVGLIMKSFFGALLPIAGLAIALSSAFMYFGDYSFRESLVNAIPFCVISSSIAIPSVRNLGTNNKEFIIYESSLSDILGVLLFNFLAFNEVITAYSFGNFAFKLVIITIISFIATIGLSFLLSKIEHHVKFVPIILLVVLIYALSEIYHLPALIFILIFGLAIGNLDELKKYEWIQRFRPEDLNKEVTKFKELTTEAAFLIRAIFFILFGYLIETIDVINPDTFLWSIGVVACIFGFRALQLKLSKLPLKPLLFVAPRGLITILLFLSIAPSQSIPLVNNSLVIQVIILTALVMMIGLMTHKNEKQPVKKGENLADLEQSPSQNF